MFLFFDIISLLYVHRNGGISTSGMKSDIKIFLNGVISVFFRNIVAAFEVQLRYYANFLPS